MTDPPLPAVPLTIPVPGFTEPVSALTHLLGVGVFAVLGAVLLRRGRGDPLRLAFLTVYSLSAVLLLSMSGMYHLLSFGGAARAVLARLDHGAIFVLIAGTFTPVHGILFRAWGRWGMLLLVWGTAAAGIILKTVFFDDMSEGLGLVLYLGLGSLGVASGLAIWQRHGAALLRPLLWGALAYTAGAVLEFLRWPVLLPGVVGAHEVFHVAVLAGAGLNWLFVYRIADGTLAWNAADGGAGPDRGPEGEPRQCSRSARSRTAGSPSST